MWRSMLPRPDRVSRVHADLLDTLESVLHPTTVTATGSLTWVFSMWLYEAEKQGLIDPGETVQLSRYVAM